MMKYNTALIVSIYDTKEDEIDEVFNELELRPFLESKEEWKYPSGF